MQVQVYGIIGQTIAQYNTLLEDTDTAEITEEIIERRKEELLKQAQEVIPEEEFYSKEVTTEEEEIKELAKIRVKLELYAYRHKDEIEGLKASVEELKNEEKTAENREELLQKIRSLETRYKVFGRYIKEEDWENLYRTKFDILMCDINQRTESPLVGLLVDQKELIYYDKILTEKIEAIVTGKNPELIRAFGESVPKAVEIIKGILQENVKEYNTYDMLQDKDALRLILAFDKTGGLEEITVNKDEVKGLNEEDFDWTDTIPLKTLYFRLKIDPEYSTYKAIKENHIKFSGSLYDLLIYYSVINRQVEERIHEMPEGIKKIKKFNRQGLGTDVEFEIKCPETLQEIGEEAFPNNSNLSRIYLNSGLEIIDEDAFKGTKLQEVLDDASVVIPEELPERLIDRVNSIETIKRKLKEYINAHYLEEIKGHKSEDTEQLLEQIEDLKKRYDIFNKNRQSQIEENKVHELLYRLKFKVLMLGIENQEESPFANLDTNGYEYQYYKNILKEKILGIINGKNSEVRRLFGENLTKATSILKEILGDGENGIDLIMWDKRKLELIMSFNEMDGFKKIQIETKQIASRRYDLDRLDIEWADKIPLETVIRLNRLYFGHDKLYGESISFKDENPYVKLCNMVPYDGEKVGAKIHIIPEGIIQMGWESYWQLDKFHDDSFKKSGYKTIIFPSTMKKILGGVFTGCNELENVKFNEGLKQIGHSAFQESGLKRIKTPSTLQRIDVHAFKCCANLRQVVLNEGLGAIHLEAFQDTAIERLETPTTLKVIGSDAFASCKKLKKVYLNSGLQIIGDSAFEDSGIEEINIPPAVKQIEYRTFKGCEYLKTIHFNDGLEKINWEAFLMSGLEEIKTPSTLTYIGNHAFGSCENLRSLILNPQLKMIHSTAFGRFKKDKMV